VRGVRVDQLQLAICVADQRVFIGQEQRRYFYL
jgi:hypothetical protein